MNLSFLIKCYPRDIQLPEKLYSSVYTGSLRATATWIPARERTTRGRNGCPGDGHTRVYGAAILAVFHLVQDHRVANGLLPPFLFLFITVFIFAATAVVLQLLPEQLVIQRRHGHSPEGNTTVDETMCMLIVASVLTGFDKHPHSLYSPLAKPTRQ